MSFRTSNKSLLFRGLAVPAAALVAVGILSTLEFAGASKLDAAPVQRPRDPDADGLTNLQETVLGTNRFQADTDGDGYSDLEELARKSSPIFAESTPANARMRVGMSCAGGESRLHALIALYLPDGTLRNKSVKAGIIVGDRAIPISDAYLANHCKLVMRAAQDPNARIAVLDFPILPRLVRGFGDVSMYVTLGDSSQGIVQAADSIHLIAIGSQIVLQVANPMILGTGSLSGTGQQTGGGTGSGSIGSIYVPLPIGNDQIAWTAGQVCVQQTNLIGVSGAMMTQQVVSAECQEGWDGYCPSNCAATVGNTYTTVDPVTLIGG